MSQLRHISYSHSPDNPLPPIAAVTHHSPATDQPYRSVACQLLTSLCIAALVCGCSDGNSKPVQSGIFLDAAVSGLSYDTDSLHGISSSVGEFSYRSGEAIIFSLGSLQLPSIDAAPTVTPLSFWPNTQIDDPRVINLARLLQSLDLDANPANGIDIGQAAAASAPTALDFASVTFDTDVANLVANSGSLTTELLSSEIAQAHLQATLTRNGLLINECGNDHPAVGSEADFSNLAFGVSGQLEILDNCTLAISDFSYTGEGDQVFFHAAHDRAYGSDAAFVVGPLLSGTRFRNKLFILTLPPEKTLDDFNGISVWSEASASNFGDAHYGEP